MKKIILKLNGVLIIILFCGMYSFNKSSLLNNPSFGSVTATVNGVSYKANAVAAMSKSKGRISITAVQTSPAQEMMFAFKGTATGTYPLNATATTLGNAALFYDGAMGGKSTVSYWTDKNHTGTITISKLDIAGKLMSGSFSFTAVQAEPLNSTATVSVTSGVFTDLPVR